jgi:hypothetical protein
MNEPMGTPIGEPAEPKKSRTWLIVLVVVVILCICCVAVVLGGWFFGDPLMNALGISL